MSRLSELRTRLRQLQRRRAGVRYGSVLALIVTLAMAGWVLAFALDAGVHLSWAARALVLTGWIGGLVVAVHRFLWPLMKSRETLSDVALVVERAHGIDSDLVAALQFDDEQSSPHESRRLTSAVIDYVAEFSHSLDVYRGFSWHNFPQRMLAVLVSLSIVTVLAGMAPAHAGVFWNRFWLGHAQYPTRTHIASIHVNQVAVDLTSRSMPRIPLVQNQPLTIEVQTTGETPAVVRAVVHSRTSRESTAWVFSSHTVPPSSGNDSSHFQYRFASVPQSLQVTLQAGDAVSPPFEIELLTLPLVELDWSISPPSYASQPSNEQVAPGNRRFSALQGSRIELAVRSINKPLKSVTLACGERSYPLTSSDSRPALASRWQLAPSSPLDSLQDNLPFEVRVVDEQGLASLPIVGEIRLRQDRPPKVTASVISRRVLPTAVPQIKYEALDDFGLRTIRWQMEVIRADGQRQMTTHTAWTIADGSPFQMRQRGIIGVELAPHNLAKGDEVRVTILADDERGPFPSVTGSSESIAFEMTDRNGILESLLEIDQQSAQQLDEIIDRELGIGKSSP